MSGAKLPQSMLSSRISISKKVRAGPGSVISASFKYTLQTLPPRVQPSPPEHWPSVPANPPTHRFIDMLRTRGRRSPFTTTNDLSAGHFQMSADFPQYGQIGL